MKLYVVMILTTALSGTVFASNCCVPAVPQQGVMGETVAQPHTLDIGLHYEFLRTQGKHAGRDEMNDPDHTEAIWKRVTMTLGYGVIPRLSVNAIIPYVWKNKAWHDDTYGDLSNQTDGLGDVTFMARYSLLARSFVDFRELSVGLGVKTPTGPTDRENYGGPVPLMLQPGTGSWDYTASLSYYLGTESVDWFASASVVFTGEYEGYKFGDQVSYLLSSNFHITERLDASAAFTGTMRGKDTEDGNDEPSTGRHEAWFVPGIQWAVIPDHLRVQAFLEYPIYHNLHGTGQLGSDYNLRVSMAYSLPLKNSSDED